jgi:uncharacterized protein YggU (UPF0235/DUF167 family)
VRLHLKVVPKASRNGVVGWVGEALKVCVTAAPERGRANEAVREVMAAALGVSERRVHIVAGVASARKVVEIEGLEEAEVRHKLGERLALL